MTIDEKLKKAKKAADSAYSAAFSAALSAADSAAFSAAPSAAYSAANSAAYSAEFSAADEQAEIEAQIGLIIDVLESNQNPKSEVIDRSVNSPSHYNFGKIEVIEFIEQLNLDFRLSNVIKYLSRCKHKGKEGEDLKKAKWYLDRYIEKEINKNDQ